MSDWQFIRRVLMVLAVAALAAAGLGMAAGQALRRTLSPATFRTCFFVGLLALGLYLVIRSLG